MSEFPKQFMSITELTEMGFSRRMLENLAHSEIGLAKKIIWRTSDKPRAKILINTTQLEKYKEILGL